LAANIEGEAAALIAPYLDIVRAFNPGAFTPSVPQAGAAPSGDGEGETTAADREADLVAYPGSPLIARALLRPQDRLVACETESRARAGLIAALRRDTQARVVDLDGWMALKAFVPPKERRGLVLIDPPYEARDEFERVAENFVAAFARWPTGSYLIWYPVKDPRLGARLARHVGDCAPDVLRLEISVAPPSAGGLLASAGLLVVNPPWTLARELRALMPAVAAALGQGEFGGEFRLEHRGA
jgi:23S rRNA (adenine2030-N6)-methyltransferase